MFLLFGQSIKGKVVYDMAKIKSKMTLHADLHRSFLLVNLWWSMHMSRAIVGLDGLGSHESASAKSISLPGLYFIVQS